jgi:uncharacterized protein (DUF169 family)
MDNLKEKALEINSILNLGSSLVGVKFIWQNMPMPIGSKALSGHRYCQVLMKRFTNSTAILQATCVDATIIPFIEQKLNLSFGCYGCRDATDIGNNESVLGFPFKDFHQIFDSLIQLNIKAIPDSRGKNAYTMLRKKDAEKISATDPFRKS